MLSLLAAAGLTAMLVEVAPLRPELAKASVILVATVCERLVKATMPPPAVRFVVPCKFPLPDPLLRDALTTVLLSPLRRLPNWSSIRITGCCAKTTPAIAADEGCAWMVSRLAAAGFTATVVEVAPGKLPP